MINSLRRRCFPLQCKRCKQFDIRRSLLLLHIDGNNNCGTTISISVCKHRNIEISRQYCRDQRRRLPTFSETFDKLSASFFREGYAQLPTHDPSGTCRQRRRRSASPGDAPLPREQAHHLPLPREECPAPRLRLEYEEHAVKGSPDHEVHTTNDTLLRSSGLPRLLSPLSISSMAHWNQSISGPLSISNMATFRIYKLFLFITKKPQGHRGALTYPNNPLGFSAVRS
jgi:hypothetical protein